MSPKKNLEVFAKMKVSLTSLSVKILTSIKALENQETVSVELFASNGLKVSGGASSRS